MNICRQFYKTISKRLRFWCIVTTMDLQKIPPIQQKRIVTFVNYFIIDTVSFLNKFINSSENTLWKLEKRMRKLETTLKLLEVKLNFIPESAEMVDGSNATSKLQDDEYVNESEENAVENSSKNLKETINENVEENIPTTEEIPEEVQKYVKMVKVGVPIEAVKLKMRNEGINPDMLKLV